MNRDTHSQDRLLDLMATWTIKFAAIYFAIHWLVWIIKLNPDQKQASNWTSSTIGLERCNK